MAIRRTVLLTICLLFVSASYAQETPQAFVFAVDVSGSMAQPRDFFPRVRSSIKDYIRKQIRTGDLVTIYSFGNDVNIVSDIPNFKVQSVQDIEKLMGYIDRLRIGDQKTWLSKAIDNVAEHLKATRSLHSGITITTYLFTDGKNDPPSGVPALELSEILSRHRAEFNNPNNFTYILTFDTEVDSILRKPGSGIQIVSDMKDRDLPVKMPTKVRIETESVSIDASPEGGPTTFTLAGENPSRNETISLAFKLISPDGGLVLGTKTLLVKPGRLSADIAVSVQPGEERYEKASLLVVQLVGSERNIDTIAVALSVTAPFDWGSMIPIVIGVLVIALLAVVCWWVNWTLGKRFSAFAISGLGIENIPLEEFRKTCGLEVNIGGEVFRDPINQEVLSIRATWASLVREELSLVWHEPEKTMPKAVTEESKLDKDIQVVFDGKYRFEIRRSATPIGRAQ
jgi:hypothetical protein